MSRAADIKKCLSKRIFVILTMGILSFPLSAQAGKGDIFSVLFRSAARSYMSSQKTQLSESDRTAIRNSCLTNCTANHADASYSVFCDCYCTSLSRQITKSDVLNFEKTNGNDPAWIDKINKTIESCTYSKSVQKKACLSECTQSLGTNYCDCVCTGIVNNTTKSDLITFSQTGFESPQLLDKQRNIVQNCIYRSISR